MFKSVPERPPGTIFRLMLDVFWRYVGAVLDVFLMYFGGVWGMCFLFMFVADWEVFGRYSGAILEGFGRSAHAKTLKALRIYDCSFPVSYCSCRFSFTFVGPSAAKRSEAALIKLVT